MNTSWPGLRITSPKSRFVICVPLNASGKGASRSIDDAVNRRMLAALEKPPARVVPEKVTRLETQPTRDNYNSRTVAVCNNDRLLQTHFKVLRVRHCIGLVCLARIRLFHQVCSSVRHWL